MKYGSASGIGSDSHVKFNNFTNGHSTIPKNNDEDELMKKSLFTVAAGYAGGERNDGAAQWRNGGASFDTTV